MKKNILDFIETLEGYKTACQNIHWDANSISQHELFDKIKDKIAEFQDQVSEVAQSIHGKIKLNGFHAKPYKIGTLQGFMDDLIKETTAFYKTLDGDRYIGMRSDCEAFISEAQRLSYLLSFTLKEGLMKRLGSRVDEQRRAFGRNIIITEDQERLLDAVDSLDAKLRRGEVRAKWNKLGRKPATKKARINQIYKLLKSEGVSDGRWSDDHWQGVDDYRDCIRRLGVEVNIWCENGGYCDYDHSDNMPRSKQYEIEIMYDDGMVIRGYIKFMAAGTVEDPFSTYDSTMILW